MIQSEEKSTFQLSLFYIVIDFIFIDNED